MNLMGRMHWLQHALPLSKENEHHYIESSDGPMKGTTRIDANYLLDQNNKIVGFMFEGKKFIFHNVTEDSGKILPNAKFELEKKHIDEVITQCVDIYQKLLLKKNAKKMTEKKPIAQYEFTKADIEPIHFEATDEFTKLSGKEYGMRKQTHRGATFLENKDRGLIGFRYHGKDFFIDIENKLLKRYKPELAFMHNDIEDIEKAIDQHLAETNLGLSDQPSAEDVKETKNILHNDIGQLRKQYQEVAKKKEEIYNKRWLMIEKDADERVIKRHDTRLSALGATSRNLSKRIKNAESDIAKLSKFSLTAKPKEAKSQEEHLSELKKQSNDILAQASKTDDTKTLFDQYQKLKELNSEIESIEKNIKKD